MALQNVTVEDQCLTVSEVLVIPIAKYITIAANNCGYSVKVEELIDNYVHNFILIAKTEERK